MKAFSKQLVWLGLILVEGILSLATILFIARVVVVPTVAISHRADHRIIKENEQPFAFAMKDPFWQPIVKLAQRDKKSTLNARREVRKRKL